MTTGEDLTGSADSPAPERLRVVGAGLPRTGTHSLQSALTRLLGQPCYHMTVIPGHPFDLGEPWQPALAGEHVAWESALGGFAAAVDWPASSFWGELAAANPDAVVLLSARENAEVWLASLEATILPYAREAASPKWTEKRDLVTLFERFVGSTDWDDPAALMTAYDRHTAAVRREADPGRLLEWQAADGWGPLCAALGVDVPSEPFPWTNRRDEWS